MAELGLWNILFSHYPYEKRIAFFSFSFWEAFKIAHSLVLSAPGDYNTTVRWPGLAAQRNTSRNDDCKELKHQWPQPTSGNTSLHMGIWSKSCKLCWWGGELGAGVSLIEPCLLAEDIQSPVSLNSERLKRQKTISTHSSKALSSHRLIPSPLSQYCTPQTCSNLVSLFS